MLLSLPQNPNNDEKTHYKLEIIHTFHDDHPVQAGLVGILVQRFRTAIAVTLVYISLSIGFHVWSLHVRWDNPADPNWWTDGLLTLYVIQRFCEASAWASVFLRLSSSTLKLILDISLQSRPCTTTITSAPCFS